MMKYDLVIFDLDGTLLNTIDDIADSCNEVLRRNNLPVHTTEEIKYMVGNGIPKLIERAIPADSDKAVYEKVLSEFIDYYELHSSEKTAPYPGIPELLSELKKNGVKLAVNSNKIQKASEDLCAQYFPGVFDVVAGGKLDQPPKPAPIGVETILQKTGISKERTLYVGDSDVDIQTGKNAGIDEIGVDWGFRGEKFLKEHGALKTVKICTELFNSIQCDS